MSDDVVAPAGVIEGGAGVGCQRARILEAALRLMAEGGVHAMSMRRLAGECGLNVATIYHYFPSKAELLRQVITQRSYAQALAVLTPPVDRGLPLRSRLQALLVWVWDQMCTQEDMWRLLLGEGLRGEPEALRSAAELSCEFEAALTRWLTELMPELDADPEVAARVLRGAIYGFFVENLSVPAGERSRRLARLAPELAAVVVC